MLKTLSKRCCWLLLALVAGGWLGRGSAAAGEAAAPPPHSSSNLTTDGPRGAVDDAAAARAGIRKLASRRLTLYTDMPPGPEIEILPAVFDQAFPQWCRYFNVSPTRQESWKMTGFLMKDKARFLDTGLLPAWLPNFLHGYSVNDRLWLYDQPSDYYRRHLLLHEGTHGFMRTILGRCGPPWYMEGMAELLGTHRWQQGKLELNYLPGHREEVPMWGRIKLIQDAVAQRRPMTLDAVLDYQSMAYLEKDPYAWCWAATLLLDRHPRYRERFRTVYQWVKEPDFTDRVRRLFAADWQPLCEEWQLMVADMQYGQDVARAAVDFTPGKGLPPGEASVEVAADRGWQNSGLRLEAGRSYRLTAAGRFQIARRYPQEIGPIVQQDVDTTLGVIGDATTPPGQRPIWWSEPNGVSIRYHHGRPLGILLAAVRPDAPPPGSSSALLRPYVVGLEATIKPDAAGTLFLKINDSPAELDDNAGQCVVKVAAGSQ